MFRRTTRQSPLWPAAALLALLAAPHTLLAQNAPATVRAEVTNRTAKPVEFALVGPDGKDLGPARSVQPGKVYQTSNRTLPGGSTKGYKWVVREPDTRRVLKEVPADRVQQSITVGGTRPAATFTPADSGSAKTPQQKGQVASGQNQAELLRLINQHRQANGQGPLSMDSSLTKAAQDHTDWMQATGTFSHTGKNGSSMGDRIQAVGGQPNPSAENIAESSTPQSAFNLWRNSAGHNRNMLGAYRKVGIGYKGGYWTAVFTN
jgi:uncharacterized protein YkwD